MSHLDGLRQLVLFPGPGVLNAPQGRLNTVSQPLRKNLGPLRDRRNRYADGMGRSSRCAAKKVDSFRLAHANSLARSAITGKLAKCTNWLNLPMPTLEDRLREVMTSKSWRNADLMRVSGQSSSVVSQWLGKGSKEIKTIGKLEAAQAIAAASGYATLWIAKGIGPKLTGETPTGDTHSISAAVDLIADVLDGMAEEDRQRVAQRLQMLAQAPDSRRTRSALVNELVTPKAPSRKAA